MVKKEPKSWKEEGRERAWVLYQVGWSQKQIAEALGVTKGAVSQWIKAGKEGSEAALKSCLFLSKNLYHLIRGV
jgi:predicted transcriptional regulator